jgi:hypothetical protein
VGINDLSYFTGEVRPAKQTQDNWINCQGILKTRGQDNVRARGAKRVHLFGNPD